MLLVLDAILEFRFDVDHRFKGRQTSSSGFHFMLGADVEEDTFVSMGGYLCLSSWGSLPIRSGTAGWFSLRGWSIWGWSGRRGWDLDSRWSRGYGVLGVE